MYECPNCGETLMPSDLDNEFCPHCFEDLDSEDIINNFNLESDDLDFDDENF